LWATNITTENKAIMSCTKLKIYYATGGGARHLSVKLSKQVQEYGDKYGYESLSISHKSYFITIRYNSTVLMQRDVIPAGNWPMQSIISYEWIADNGSTLSSKPIVTSKPVEAPKPVVEVKKENTEPDDTIILSDILSDVTYKNLPQKLEQVARKCDEKINKEAFDDDKWKAKKNKEQALAQVIKCVAVPSEKSDLLEFLIMLQTAFLSPTTEFYSAAAYYTKYQEGLLKAKMLFANEDIFNAILNNEQQVQTQFQEVQKKQSKVEDEKPSKKTSKKLGLVCICLAIAYFILMYIIW
jgi:hypothetical protein